jgi:hypothetical protein
VIYKVAIVAISFKRRSDRNLGLILRFKGKDEKNNKSHDINDHVLRESLDAADISINRLIRNDDPNRWCLLFLVYVGDHRTPEQVGRYVGL